jgi:hypothetical protein
MTDTLVGHRERSVAIQSQNQHCNWIAASLRSSQ